MAGWMTPVVRVAAGAAFKAQVDESVLDYSRIFIATNMQSRRAPRCGDCQFLRSHVHRAFVPRVPCMPMLFALTSGNLRALLSFIGRGCWARVACSATREMGRTPASQLQHEEIALCRCSEGAKASCRLSCIQQVASSATCLPPTEASSHLLVRWSAGGMDR